MSINSRLNDEEVQSTPIRLDEYASFPGGWRAYQMQRHFTLPSLRQAIMNGRRRLTTPPLLRTSVVTRKEGEKSKTGKGFGEGFRLRVLSSNCNTSAFQLFGTLGGVSKILKLGPRPI